MTDAKKIDSNVTDFRYAEEAGLGILDTPAWKSLAPNSYKDFGSEIKTVSPNPINSSRQRRKGITTDVDAMAGFEQNLDFFSLKDLMQGAMFANFRTKGTFVGTEVQSTTDAFKVASGNTRPAGTLIFTSGYGIRANNGLFLATSTNSTSFFTAPVNLSLEATAPAGATIQTVGFQCDAGDFAIVNDGVSYPVMNTTAHNFVTMGIVAGQWIYIGGDVALTRFTNAVNNGFKRVRSVSTNQLVLDKSATTMVTEPNPSQTVQIFFGDVLKNELLNDIVRRSYHLERTLGASDTAAPTDLQSEIVIGALVDELTLTIPQSDLITMDFSFVGIDSIQRTSVEGPLATGVVRPNASPEFNSTSDVQRIRMTILSETDANVTPLFGFITEAKFMLKNNVKPDKAVGVLGAFEMTVGTLEISGSVEAYFSNVSAIQAIRNNADVTIDAIIAKDNRGIILDLPLISLGDGRAKVVQDEAIMMPLKMDAATAIDIDPNLDYTAMWTYFFYLPTVAM